MATRRTHPLHPNRPTASHLSLGREGERRAALYLRRKGYRIEDQNVRIGGVEIDLIARQGAMVIFIEVKTRRSRQFGPPESAVDARKQRKLVQGALAWLSEKGRGVSHARFDVIAWQVDSASKTTEAWECRHIEGAFDAGP